MVFNRLIAAARYRILGSGRAWRGEGVAGETYHVGLATGVRGRMHDTAKALAGAISPLRAQFV